MRCDEVRDRLVALDDHELSRSEAHLVREHLRHCPRCATHHEALAGLRIEPFLAPPVDVWKQLDAACATDELWRRAHRPSPVPAPSRVQRWLREPVPMNNGTALAWAAVFVMGLSWGAASWWAPSQGAPPAPTAASEIPADHYRPASYVPEEDAAFP